MNNILVLVDFTDTASIAMRQAIALSKAKGGKITICHIDSDEDDSTLEKFSYLATDAGVENEIVTESGDLFHAAASVVDRIHPDLIIVGTHGKQGVKQHLFGSAVYKLVSGIHAPTLVMNDNTDVVEKGFNKVMMPVAAHDNYHIKVEQTCRILAEGGTVVIFAIVKPGVALDAETLANVKNAQEYLTEKGVNWTFVEEDANRFSVGYSKDTMDYAVQNSMDLISIMADINHRNAHFGKMDKENMLLNENGIAVLCANS